VPARLAAALWQGLLTDPPCCPNCVFVLLLSCAAIDGYRVVGTPTSGPIITVTGMGAAGQGTLVSPHGLAGGRVGGMEGQGAAQGCGCVAGKPLAIAAAAPGKCCGHAGVLNQRCPCRLLAAEAGVCGRRFSERPGLQLCCLRAPRRAGKRGQRCSQLCYAQVWCLLLPSCPAPACRIWWQNACWLCSILDVLPCDLHLTAVQLAARPSHCGRRRHWRRRSLYFRHAPHSPGRPWQ
jgi:hypothetical protein